MEGAEDDDDLGLIKASASLLTDLEHALPRLLWKPAQSGNGSEVHAQVRRRDLDHVQNLIEPFQSDPQLLDARLKHIVPPIVVAYLAFIQLPSKARPTPHLDLEAAVCSLLYTLCKVRGSKVILAFLSNEPRYLEPILLRLENASSHEQGTKSQWQVPYVLLLWLSHLLLTPFDLASISGPTVGGNLASSGKWPEGLPFVALRVLDAGLYYLPTSTKAQDAAAMLLVRLVRRPDMQKLQLAGSVVADALKSLQNEHDNTTITVYERLGPLRILSGVVASPELSHLIPDVYRASQRLSEDAGSFVATNAVAKRLVIKVFRDIAIFSLRAGDIQGALLNFLETTSVLEDVIDYLLRCLGDRDTPVRFAAAKAISMIVLALDADLRKEVIQAVLDTFKEDMPRNPGEAMDFRALDFRTADALKWHGLTLCLAHTLFKRSASPSQLPEIVEALICALQFEQRTATGSSVGTNVRDAANFGIWSLSRRYSTDELLTVDPAAIDIKLPRAMKWSTMQYLAIELVLSACLDPAGNIRRGSSAALQELIGRHPDQVKEGIALVQTVDYQAVGLRRRAMVDVAARAVQLHLVYFRPVLRALLRWRGLGSADVASREAAAQSLARLTDVEDGAAMSVAYEVVQFANTITSGEREILHGVLLTMALIFEKQNAQPDVSLGLNEDEENVRGEVYTILHKLNLDKEDFSPRLLRSELPSAIAKVLAAECAYRADTRNYKGPAEERWLYHVPFEFIESLTERLMARGEESIRETVPALTRSLLALKQEANQPLACVGSQTLVKQVGIDGAKTTLHGAGRAMALGALAPFYGSGLRGETAAEAVRTLGSLVQAVNVDWRVIGIRALQFAVEGNASAGVIEPAILGDVVKAVHQGLHDYTIDERGDVGSLVRLQAIACTSTIFVRYATGGQQFDEGPLQILQADILRLCLEKIDRVRLAAAQCQIQHITQDGHTLDIAAVSSPSYFLEIFRPLAHPEEPEWKHRALLEGAVSAAGISAEPLLRASRAALATTLACTTNDHLCRQMTFYTTILRTSLTSPTSPLTTPALALLAYLLDTRIPHRLSPPLPFKWINLLSAVQKAHHKSNDIPKIAAAVAVYGGLAEVEGIRDEVLKKLLAMLRTNPYPRVRMGVAEVLFVVVGRGGSEGDGDGVKEMLTRRDWMGDRQANESIVKELERRLLKPS